MPFKSEKQRRYMWAKHPDIARRWTRKYGGKMRVSSQSDTSVQTGVSADPKNKQKRREEEMEAIKRRLKNRRANAISAGGNGSSY